MLPLIQYQNDVALLTDSLQFQLAVTLPTLEPSLLFLSVVVMTTTFNPHLLTANIIRARDDCKPFV